jgi:hypothetical protein
MLEVILISNGTLGTQVQLNLCLTIPATRIPANGLDPEELELVN